MLNAHPQIIVKLGYLYIDHRVVVSVIHLAQGIAGMAEQAQKHLLNLGYITGDFRNIIGAVNIHLNILKPHPGHHRQYIISQLHAVVNGIEHIEIRFFPTATTGEINQIVDYRRRLLAANHRILQHLPQSLFINGLIGQVFAHLFNIFNNSPQRDIDVMGHN